MEKKKQNIKTNLLFMPRKFSSLSKKDLVKAFFAYYYELIIGKSSERETKLIINFAEDSIANDDLTNDILWKKLWYLYIAYSASMVGFHSLESASIKEISMVDEVSNDEYMEFLGMADSCFRAYNDFKISVCPSFRLYVAFKQQWVDVIKIQHMSAEEKKYVEKQIKPYVKKLVLFNKFLETNEFFDPIQVVFDWIEKGISNNWNMVPEFESSFAGIFYPDKETMRCITQKIKDFLGGGAL